MECQLAYEEHGSGFPLFLLHGNGENRSYFQGQLAPLAARFHVIAVDTRGHGQSPHGNAPFTLSQFADDHRLLMDRLRIPRAHLLGFSDGGNIALLFTLRYPERVERLVLNGANLYPSGMVAPIWLAIDALYVGACVASVFNAKATHARDMLGLMATQPHIPKESLAAVTVPVLVIAGTHDLIRRRHTRLIARSLPNAQLCLLSGSHTVARDHPTQFNREVISFLTAADKP